jgi:hypothetical protein
VQKNTKTSKPPDIHGSARGLCSHFYLAFTYKLVPSRFKKKRLKNSNEYFNASPSTTIHMFYSILCTPLFSFWFSSLSSVWGRRLPTECTAAFRDLLYYPAIVSPFHLHRRSTSIGVRDLYQRKVELWARNIRSNLAIKFDFHVNYRVVLHAAKPRHGADGFTSPTKEGMLRIFRPKNPGLNPRTWVPEASTLTTRPPKPLSFWFTLYLLFFYLYELYVSKLKCLGRKNVLFYNRFGEFSLCQTLKRNP